MPYQIPPWIPGAPDVANQFLGGVRAGSAIAQEQQRLAQEANLAQMKAMLDQQQFERSNALEQQRLAQQQAYQTAEIGLRKQELDQAQKVNQIKIQESARTFAAQQQFQQWMQDNPDKDPAEGILKFFPGTGEAMTGYGQIARQMYQDRLAGMPPTEGALKSGGVNYPYLATRTGGIHFAPVNTANRVGERRIDMKIQSLQRQAATLEKELETDPGAAIDPKTMTKEQEIFYKAYKAKKDRLDKINQDIDELYAGADISELNDAVPRAWDQGASSGAFKIISQDGQPYQATGAAPVGPQPVSDFPYTPPQMPPGPQRPWDTGGAMATPFGAQGAAPMQLPQSVAGQTPFSQYIPAPYRAVGRGAQSLAAPFIGGLQTLSPIAAKGAANMMTLPSWLLNRMSQQAETIGQ